MHLIDKIVIQNLEMEQEATKNIFDVFKFHIF